MPRLHYAQLRYLSIILLAWLAVFFLTRSVLLLSHLGDASVSLTDLFGLYGVGLVYDLSFLVYAVIPMTLYLLLCPAWLWRRRWHQRMLVGVVAVSLFVMFFTAVAEWLFWDEFGVRFNFIAVDYLVYSKEVVNNILESYPIYPLLSLLAVVAIGLTFALRRTLHAALQAPRLPFSRSLYGVLMLALLVGLCSGLVGQDAPRGLGGNTYQRELASNGPYQFFAAFRNNELDYRQFYATLPDGAVAGLLREEVSEPNARFIGRDPEDIRRVIDNPGKAKPLNVVLVTIESLSAKYLGSFGDTRGLTPNSTSCASTA